MQINMNDHVKVKLTEVGIKELKRQHEELNEHIVERGGIPFSSFQLNIDEEGYTKFQLWDLMSKFGHLVSMGLKPPFEMNIKLD